MGIEIICFATGFVCCGILVGIKEIFDDYAESKAALEQELQIGHWIRKTKVDAYDIAGVKTWGIKCQCDRCDFTMTVIEDFGYYTYCPNCGATMKSAEGFGDYYRRMQ